MNPVRIAIACLYLVSCRVAIAEDPRIGESDRLNSLVEQLRVGDDEQRRLAARELRDSESRDESVVKSLAEATRDRDRQVYALAVEALARLGPDAAPALDTLMERLEDSDQQRRYRAAYAIGRMGATAVPALKQVIVDDEGRYRVAAAIHSLAWTGDHAVAVIPDLINSLGHTSEEVSEAACETLWKLGRNSADALVAATSSSNMQVRRLAALSLGQIEDADPDWAAPLGKLLVDPDVGVRAAATRAFSQVARRQKSIDCDPLIEKLADDDSNVRLEAGQGIVRIPRCWSTALPNVQELFQRTEQDVAIAAHLIERMGPLASSATEQLLNTIENRPDSRESLASALSHIGSRVVEPVVAAVRTNRIDIETGKSILRFAAGESVLTRMVTDALPADRIIAAKMLGAAEPVKQSSIDCLVDGMTSDDADMRMACVLGLGTMGEAAKSAEPAVRAAAESDASESVQAAALTTLFKIGVDPDSLVSAIVAGLSHDNIEIRRECARAMKRFETLDADQIDVLMATIADSDVVVRTNVLEAVANVSEPSPVLIGKIVETLDDTERDVRSAAYSTLAKFGELAARAVPPLTERLNEDSSRMPVMQTLAAIGRAADSASGQVKTLIGNESSEVRATSVETLGKIMVDRRELIEIVTDRLADDDWTVRKKSAEILGTEGEAAIGAVPPLIDLLQKEDDSDYARNALRGIDAAPPEAIPQLVAILAGNSDRRARFYAMHLLKKVGPAAKEAVPELTEILEQEKFDSRTQRYLKQVIEDIEDQDDEEEGESKDEG